ncbi:hypothetical protein [Alkalihalobacillus pseudalcaliphilus]|uniref:hypothetical protein n=1 Tax=Alkalihalobacillus pseudalcaliphilus TaxID=79884 RepID=UPI000AF43377|nr:hypothetical protein [Alkalihalobacillus pseudalcaliphilus]
MNDEQGKMLLGLLVDKFRWLGGDAYLALSFNDDAYLAIKELEASYHRHVTQYVQMAIKFSDSTNLLADCKKVMDEYNSLSEIITVYFESTDTERKVSELIETLSSNQQNQ